LPSEEAIATGALTLARACPFCSNMMTDGMAGTQGGENVNVLDIAELLLQPSNARYLVESKRFERASRPMVEPNLVDSSLRLIAFDLIWTNSRRSCLNKPVRKKNALRRSP
jgi:hypothetical protein